MRLFDSKKGETTELSFRPLIVLMLAVMVILIPLLKFAYDIGTKENYNRIYLARDLAILSTTSYAVPYNFDMDYPELISGFAIEDDKKGNIIVRDDDMTVTNHGSYAFYHDDAFSFSFKERIIAKEKETKKLHISKSPWVISLEEGSSQKRMPYYLPDKLSSINCNNQEIALDSVIFSADDSALKKYGVSYISSVSKGSKWKVNMKFELNSDVPGRIRIAVPADHPYVDELSVVAGNIANMLSVLEVKGAELKPYVAFTSEKVSGDCPEGQINIYFSKYSDFLNADHLRTIYQTIKLASEGSIDG